MTRCLQFLLHVSGFDCVDDESASEADFSSTHPLPSEVTLEYLQSRPQNPLSFNYYMYYLWANINVLNQFRASRNLPPFAFRPHAGEAGPLDHLAGTYLVSDGIAHGINLRLSPVLQYALPKQFLSLQSKFPLLVACTFTICPKSESPCRHSATTHCFSLFQTILFLSFFEEA